jgi:hypothetical protein
VDFLPTEDETRQAEAVLGSEHPLARALSKHRTVARQALVALTPLPASILATVVGIAVAPVFLGATLLVAGAYTWVLLATRGAVLDSTQDHIARGEDTDDLPVVARERRRLISQPERERLARSLEQALDAAWSWERTPPPSRPLYGTQCLRDSAAEVRSVVRKLRTARVRAQGVALVARLLGDGERSPLYAGDSVRLREELCRIRYLLEPRPGRPERRRLQSSAAS